MKILIVEDEKITRITLANLLKKEGYEVDSADNGEHGIEAIRKKKYDVIITDLKLPRKDGMEVLKTAKELHPGTDVIVITAYATVETAVSTLKLGAYDYIMKPISPERFLSLIQKISDYQQVRIENTELKKKLEKFEKNSVIGKSGSMKNVLETLQNVAPHNYTVLIQGESGTGKEVIARTLHQFSERSDGPFVAVNCAVIPETLLESELFGHEKGSFSGAVQQHKGYFERASGGTLLIDDIDDMPLHLQVKLLRVLQEKQIVRVGGVEDTTVDVRVVCATKVDLEELVKQKKFREDLFYRLNIIPINLPPLRERKEDIPLLVNHFFKKHGAEEFLKRLDGQFYQLLEEYDWPGNVRQLENTVERIIATNDISIPATLKPTAETNKSTDSETIKMNNDKAYPPYKDFIQEKEEEIINWALRESGNNITKAAELLDLPRGTLRSKLGKLE